ncbi:DNA-binding protein RFX5 isoform X2 [Grus americana]|uniref:DNA-binding protein RFX5 isoform X2 n=1 Tax=Grus americana TaxID=9117 RepID=UPI0024085F15|nr:DNA-binding protein RFX5 isoform X2 [Grus americana]
MALGTCPPAAPPASLFSCPHAPGVCIQDPWDCHGPHQHPQPGAGQAGGDLPFWFPPGHAGPGTLSCAPSSPARNGVHGAGRCLCCWRRLSWGHFHVRWWLPLTSSPPLTRCADGAQPAELGLVFGPARMGAEGGRVLGCAEPRGCPALPFLPHPALQEPNVMADKELSARAAKKGSLSPSGSRGSTTESSTLLQELKSSISKSVQNKVDSILQDVQKFSDNDKLYLYLQLPSGPSLGEKSGSLDLSSLSTAEYMHACNWIRNHLEEHTDTCLPKKDVYDAYKRYCDNLCCRPLSTANFGKIIREIFPNIKARRLGGRGQSQYCYSGIRRKTVVSLPPLPSLDLKVTETPSELSDLVQSYNSEVMEAACALTCDWAEKILKRSFNNIVEVAQFLIQQHIISSRSARADLVMAMVVSESTEKIHREGRTPLTTKKNGLDASESGDRSQGQIKKDSSPKPPGTPRPEKKKPPEPPKAASSPQVNALVARLPLLLPRIPPGERPTAPGAAAIRSSPPILAPKITATPLGGTVKVALPLPVGTASPSLPLGLAPGANGAAGLLSQQAAVPVLNVLLPGVGVPAAESPANPRSVGGGEGPGPQDSQRPRATKRPLEPAGDAAPQKRRRGRPRKRPEEGVGGSPGGMALGAGDGGSPGGGSAPGPLGDSPGGGSLPTQVSVIHDGRTGAKVASNGRELAPEEEAAQRSPSATGSPLGDSGGSCAPRDGQGPPLTPCDGHTPAGTSPAAAAASQPSDVSPHVPVSRGGSPGRAGLCAPPGT